MKLLWHYPYDPISSLDECLPIGETYTVFVTVQEEDNSYLHLPSRKVKKRARINEITSHYNKSHNGKVQIEVYA